MFLYVNILVKFTKIHGHDSTSVSVYQPFNDVRQMPFARSDMTAIKFEPSELGVSDTRIYLYGGCNADQSCFFNVSNPRVGSGCYCQNITSRCAYYTPVNDKWYDGPTYCDDAPQARYRHASAKVGDKVYVIGGRRFPDKVIETIDIYDPKTNTWDPTGIQWPNATSDLTAFGYGTDLYLVGGYDQNYTVSNKLTKYDTKTKTWTVMPNMKHPRGDVVSTEYLGQFYVAGGYESYTYNETLKLCQPPTQWVEAYNPVTKTWTEIQNLHFGRADMVLAELDGHLFAVAGEKAPDTDPSW